MKQRFLLALSLSFLGLAAQAAEPYPTRPVTLVVGYPPGGSADSAARLLSERLAPLLGQPVIVDNRPGAAGNLAAELVARAPANGYTLLFGSSSLATNPFVYDKLRYNIRKDFVPVSTVVSLPLLISVTPSLPVTNLKDWVALARSKPGEFSYGTSGNGSLGHLTMEGFKQSQHLNVVHVPYKGSAPMLTGLMGGEIGVTFDATSSGLPLAKAGKIRALAVTSSRRLTGAPDVPTVAEAGFPDAKASGWYGVLSPAKTPPEIIDRLNAAIRKAMAAPGVAETLQAQGVELDTSTPKAFADLITQDLVRYEREVKLSGAKVE